MWPFRRKKEALPPSPGIVCPFCGSTGTRPLALGSDGVKVWRGNRAIVYRCFDCRRDFYADGTPGDDEFEDCSEDDVVDDEAALREAEEELRKQVEENDDRRFPRYP